MITTDKLRQFKDSLDETLLLVNSLLAQRTRDSLYKSSDDYYLALKDCNFVPQEYYKLRLFDSELTLNYNIKNKCFYIKIDTTKYDFLKKLDFQEFCSKNHLFQSKISDKDFYFEEGINLEKAVEVFLNFIHLWINFYITVDKLFVYN